MSRPVDSEYAPYYQSYIARVSENDIVPVLRSQLDELDELLSKVKPDGETYAYAEGKWSIRELVGHLIDAERVFGYRAFCIARGERQNLPGFDQNDYLLTAPYRPNDDRMQQAEGPSDKPPPGSSRPAPTAGRDS